MASIPLAANNLKTDYAQPSPLEMYGQIMDIKNAQQEQQLRQQQMATGAIQQQGAQLDVQQKQQDLNDQKAISKWYMGIDPKDPNAFDPVSVGKTLAQAGVSGKGIMAAQQQILEHQKTVLGMTKDQLANQQEVNGNLYNAVDGVIGVTDPQQRAQMLTPIIQMAAQNKAISPDQAQQMLQNPATVTDDLLKNFQHGLGVSSAFMASVARKQQADTGQQALQAKMNPSSTLYEPSQASVALGTAPGAAQIRTGQANEAAQKASAEAAARQPYELALAAQRQALSQGDPKAAGHLLVTGDATLAELKARGATPEFIEQTLQAAHAESGGQYNAQAADAQFDVAKSPANVAFFGSAKSLTDKGGTLDQLAEAAKQIPGGKIPAFNSIADWEKAATGSGPIARYASLALGVADDYSKVMGGGQGSDSSRMSALNLVGAKLSPEQRAGSIEGIRGAVSSQAGSRIGDNPVLQRMYGSQFAKQGGGANAGTVISVGSVITQNGHRYKVTAVDKNGKPTAADPVQ